MEQNMTGKGRQNGLRGNGGRRGDIGRRGNGQKRRQNTGAADQAVHQWMTDILFHVKQINARLMLRWAVAAGIGFLAACAILRGEIAPFGLALAALTAAGAPSGLWLGTLLGTVLFQPWQLPAFVVVFVASRFTRNRWIIMASVAAGLALSAALRNAFAPWLLYDWLMRLVECAVASLTVIMGWQVVGLLSGLKRRQQLTQEEWLSLSMAWAIALLGCARFGFLGFQPARALAVFAILCFSQSGTGMGAAMGVVMGVALSLSGEPVITIAGLSLGGLIAGAFRDWKRPGIVIAFMLSNALTALYMGIPAVLIDSAVAGVAFLLFARTLRVDSAGLPQAFHLKRLREMWVNRLVGFSATFHEMALTFEGLAAHRIPRQQEVARLLESVAEHVCARCPLRRSCWEADFYSTYQGLTESLRYIEKNRILPREALPARLRERCIQLNILHQQLQMAFRLQLQDRAWQENLQSCRRLVGEQLQGVSSVVMDLANEVRNDVRFDSQTERRIQESLERAGLGVRGVLVQLDTEGRMEVHLEKRPCGAMFIGVSEGGLKPKRREKNGKQAWRTAQPMAVEGCRATAARHNQTLELLREITGHPLAMAERRCAGGKAGCVWVYREKAVLSVVVGQAALAASNEWQKAAALDVQADGLLDAPAPLNGDTMTARDIGQGKYLLALSDGMGNGMRAAQESGAVIALLEQYYDAGMPTETIYKLLNSVLILRSSEEMFATVDVCLLDLIGGWADFVKVGAETGYVLRGHQLTAIRAANVPLGIVEEVQPVTERMRLEVDDIIIMLSDGILDMALEEQDRAVARLLKGLGQLNPQGMAEQILDRALKDKEQHDDMTVMVARICKG